MVIKNRKANISQERKGDLVFLPYSQDFSQDNLASKPSDPNLQTILNPPHHFYLLDGGFVLG